MSSLLVHCPVRQFIHRRVTNSSTRCLPQRTRILTDWAMQFPQKMCPSSHACLTPAPDELGAVKLAVDVEGTSGLSGKLGWHVTTSSGP